MNILGAVKTGATLALEELKHHSVLVLLVIVLAFAGLAPYMFVEDSGDFHLKVFVFLWAGLILLAFVQRHAYFIFCLILVPANLVYVHLNRHWGDKQLVSRIEAAFESPPREALEYLQAHLDRVDAAVILFFVLYVLVLIGVTFRSTLPRLAALKQAGGMLFIAWLIVLAALRMDQKLHEFPPYQLSAEIVHAKARFSLLKDRRDYLAAHPLPAARCSSKYDKVVIVLGESAVSDHMSVFGYGKPTTPFAVRSKPYAFNALAPSNQTRYSIPMLLSDASPGNFAVFYRDHSLVGQLRACGFHTTWISNQGRVGVYDSFTTSLAMEADEQIFLNEWSWTQSKFDEQIVDELATRGLYARHHQVTFIHLIGSHTSYDERYPKGFGFADVSGTVAQYDNSLLYTDHVLSELYRHFHDDSTLFLYVSDHGQFVSQDKFGSGFLPGYKEEYRVPLLIWTRDAASIAQMRAAIGGAKVNTDSLNNIVYFLLGLSVTPALSTSRTVSVLSPDKVVAYDDLAAFSGN